MAVSTASKQWAIGKGITSDHHAKPLIEGGDLWLYYVRG